MGKRTMSTQTKEKKAPKKLKLKVKVLEKKTATKGYLECMANPAVCNV